MIAIIPYLLGVFNIVLRGIIVYFFWRWFVVTQFVNVDQLSVIGCIGLSVFIDVLTPWRRFSTEEVQESLEETVNTDVNNCFYYFMGLLLSFGLGWIVTLFM